MVRFDARRTAVIHGPPPAVHDALTNFETWPKWSPWLVAQPDASINIDGPRGGEGATYAWSGNIIGRGTLRHRSITDDVIRQELRIEEPFASVGETAFELRPTGDGSTEVTWRMRGNLPWFLFWMRGKMGSVVGMDYDRGLRRLDAYVRHGHVPMSAEVIGEVTAPRHRIVGLGGRSQMKTLDADIARVFERIASKRPQSVQPPAGPVGTIYDHFDMKTETFDYFTGDVDAPSIDGLAERPCGGCRCLHVRHTGSYHFLADAWSVAYQIAGHRKLKLTKTPSFEINVNHHTAPADDQRVTEIYLPVG